MPKPGDLVLEVETERRAKDVVDLRLTKEKTGKLVEDDTAIEERFRKTFFLFKRSHCTKKKQVRLRFISFFQLMFQDLRGESEVP